MTERALILLVEDSETQALQMRILLEKEGFTVSRAASAEAALEAMAEARPDLLMVDYHLPGMNGDELVRQVRLNGRTRALPIVMLTGGPTRERELQGLESGASAYVPKSSDRALLIGQLRALLRQRGASDNIASPSFQRGALMLFTADPACRRLFEPLLISEGYRLLLAEDADTALRELAAEPVDCVLIDIGSDAEESLSPLAEIVAFRSSARDFEMIALGGDRQGNELTLRAFAAGADDVLLKSDDSGTQAARVRAVVRRKLARDEERRTAEHELQREAALTRARAEAAGAEALAVANEELARVNAQLAETNRGVVALHAELERKADQLRHAGESLERQVTDRTAELAQANTKLLAEAEARERAEADLRQSQKMEAVGQLTGGIAHDFNNMLAGVVGALDMVGRRLKQGRHDKLETYIEMAMASANRAAALTHRLLAFARRQPLDSRIVDVNTLIEGMEDLLRRTINESIELRLALDPVAWTTLCDPFQLENAILNLAINARDAMPSGGSIIVSTRNKICGGVGEVAHGDRVVVSVADTGTGMPPDVVARAFEPFFTTKPLGKGTGLGLSMIYGFAKQSEGDAVIESRPGEGTTISLLLPRHEGEAASSDSLTPDLEALGGRGETILLVEDEATVRDLVHELLVDAGYKVVHARDGNEGLATARTERRLDMLITDVGLPGMNGRQLADALRVARPRLKVLFITGYAEAVISPSDALEPGMAMVTKPFVLDTLVARVRELMDAA